MNDEYKDSGWPQEAGATDDLATEMAPPAELEDRVTAELLRHGLITPGSRTRRGITRGLLAAAASLLLMAVGFTVGRQSVAGQASGQALEAQTKYALLLYETDDFRRAQGAEALDRYREYSIWVADARRRGQFVTGEDLTVAEGRVISPGDERPTAERGVRVHAGAALSGIFLITARDFSQAVELAETLPHLAHGGHVVVQEVVPTEEPPAIDPRVG